MKYVTFPAINFIDKVLEFLKATDKLNMYNLFTTFFGILSIITQTYMLP